MRKLFLNGMAIFIFFALSEQLFAVDFQKYIDHMQANLADESSRSTLLGIVGSCGNSSNLDDACVVQGLERVATEENNQQAKSILADYAKSLNEGNANIPECQTESHMQVNRTMGHCLLLLNYYALENDDKDAATVKYETCLQGGMLGLAYQGNLAAQFLLADIFYERGLSEQGSLWKNSLKTRRGSEDYEILMKCYR